MRCLVSSESVSSRLTISLSKRSEPRPVVRDGSYYVRDPNIPVPQHSGHRNPPEPRPVVREGPCYVRDPTIPVPQHSGPRVPETVRGPPSTSKSTTLHDTFISLFHVPDSSYPLTLPRPILPTPPVTTPIVKLSLDGVFSDMCPHVCISVIPHPSPSKVCHLTQCPVLHSPSSTGTLSLSDLTGPTSPPRPPRTSPRVPGSASTTSGPFGESDVTHTVCHSLTGLDWTRSFGESDGAYVHYPQGLGM